MDGPPDELEPASEGEAREEKPEPASEGAGSPGGGAPQNPGRIIRTADRVEMLRRPRETDLRLPGRSNEVENESRLGPILAGAIGLAIVVGGGLLYRFLAKPDPDAPDTTASASASASSAVVPARCKAVSEDGFLVGERGKPKAAASAAPVAPPSATPSASAAPSASDSSEVALLPPEPEEPTEDLAPFAVILGRGIATSNGFAVGAMQDGEGGTVMSVVTVDDAGAGSIVRLARSRGDLEPPVVAEAPGGVLAAMLEPNASGIALKVARVAGGKVEWGAEIDQGKDESLATDVGASGTRGFVVWDDVKDDRSRIMMSSFALSSLGSPTAARVVSPEKTDAEQPRLVASDKGRFLVWLARGAELARSDPDSADGTKDKDAVDESRGERIYRSWVEAVPLDETGSPSADPVKLTPDAGHVGGFDVVRDANGEGFTLAWRDLDSPSGGEGGAVRVEHVAMGGPSEASTLVDEGAGGAGATGHPAPAGAPTLLGESWVAVADLRGKAFLGRIDASGKPIGKLAAEPSFGLADPIAAHGARILVSDPKGRAVELRVMDCAAAP